MNRLLIGKACERAFGEGSVNTAGKQPIAECFEDRSGSAFKLALASIAQEPTKFDRSNRLECKQESGSGRKSRKAGSNRPLRRPDDVIHVNSASMLYSGCIGRNAAFLRTNIRTAAYSY